MADVIRPFSPDIEHSDYEDRQKIIGTVDDVVSGIRILFVVFIKKGGENL